MRFSPNRSLRLWGPSFESLYRFVWPQVSPPMPPKFLMPCLSLVPGETQNYGFLKFMIAQNVAVAPARLKILSPPGIRSYATHFASCENVAVAPARINISKYCMVQRTLLSSTSSKIDGNYKHSWNSWFLLFIIQFHFCWNKHVILSILGVPRFVCVRLSFMFFIFPMENQTFCNVCDFGMCNNFHHNCNFNEKHNEIFTFWGARI